MIAAPSYVSAQSGDNRQNGAARSRNVNIKNTLADTIMEYMPDLANRNVDLSYRAVEYNTHQIPTHYNAADVTIQGRE